MEVRPKIAVRLIPLVYTGDAVALPVLAVIVCNFEVGFRYIPLWFATFCRGDPFGLSTREEQK